MQMLPLLLAMGGGNPGQRMLGTQLRVAMLMIEVWIDYLAAMQDFMERTLERLAGMSDGGFMCGEEAEDGEDW